MFTEDDGEGEKEENVRGHWTNKTEYLLSMIGMAVGLGNIWRFPYLVFKNGGGAFLIPYFLMLVFLGIPIYLMEISLGQFCSQGSINIWRAVPLFQGVGIATGVVNMIVSIYYGVIIAYILYYFCASFHNPLPWTAFYDDGNCTSQPQVVVNVANMSVSNWTRKLNSCPTSNVSYTEQYWDEVVLQRSSGMNETGTIVWHLALGLLLSTFIVALVLVKGIKSSGKVVYFTATFPYLVLTILLIRGLTLEGAKDGIDFYIGSKSNMTKLGEVERLRKTCSPSEDWHPYMEVHRGKRYSKEHSWTGEDVSLSGERQASVTECGSGKPPEERHPLYGHGPAPSRLESRRSCSGVVLMTSTTPLDTTSTDVRLKRDPFTYHIEVDKGALVIWAFVQGAVLSNIGLPSHGSSSSSRA
ncbi:hypothetical protein NHX12_030305 [Muraenolepis orangiensis]|uniref:Transporter n=1 Tax=Muraenolepis orangiensis TaxID=630683 RepID=A0A9Q0EBG9_9TELE|nr:hypothetical protein NHX12_030305 [Muraenolepis orangiensis]